MPEYETRWNGLWAKSGNDATPGPHPEGSFTKAADRETFTECHGYNGAGAGGGGRRRGCADRREHVSGDGHRHGDVQTADSHDHRRTLRTGDSTDYTAHGAPVRAIRKNPGDRTWRHHEI